MTGDWKVAKGILDNRKDLVRFSINMCNETALHVAAYAGNTSFVKNLVELMENDDMELQNSNSDTALCLAAVAGHLKVARILVKKHNSLLNITGSQEKTPFSELNVKYFVDEALEIVKEHSELVVSEGSTILQLLAHFPYDGYEGHVDEKNQAIQLLQYIWEKLVALPTAKIDEILRGPADKIMKDKYPSRVLFVAAEMGNTAFIVVLIRQYPERVLELNDNKQSIFHVAISHRHAGVYSLLHRIGSIKGSIVNLEDEKENNMLHLVGIPKKKETSSQYEDIKGPILQMLQEVKWFEIRVYTYT
ncbi:hypothetical protein L1887_23810 [Cichorium endivia]|nr:hypothetical protein L1887_23810 [Cichorium endivia]